MTSILLIDGDGCQAPVLRRMLERGGHSVAHETGLAHIKQYYGTFEIAMVAVDDLDGELRGMLALRELRSKISSSLRPGAPIFTVFDHASSEEERIEALRGGDLFLERPFLRQDVIGVVERLARRHGCYGHISGVMVAVDA